MIIAGSAFLHKAALGPVSRGSIPMYVAWGFTLSFVLVQFVLSWSQKAFTVTPRQAELLSRLCVAVVIPCFNEDPEILSRVLFSAFQQTRRPDYVIVVDDGSTKVDYRDTWAYWKAACPRDIQLVWLVQENAGKKHAQAAAFRAVPHADIYATMDSDSALERRAVEEGLKPFADRRVVSVAGLEMAYNLRTNLLTRAIGARSLAFQLFTMSAQSVAAGNVVINPGAFSLYRGWLIHRILPAYLGEKFFGTPVTLGDDTGLTMFALAYGRAVHQPTAVSMPAYPEKLSHHLRQWTRWMRASTIRTLWRVRYLRIRSYAFWFVLYQQYAFYASVAVSVAVPLAWPASRNIVVDSIIALIAWPLAVAARMCTIRRSDLRWTAWLGAVALLPAAALWYLLVLRQIRFYGMATCYVQSWVTRQQGAEVKSHDTAAPAPTVTRGVA
jgi:hyaluronan synthase